MLIQKISIRLNNQNTFCNLHLDIMIQILVANNFLFFLVSEYFVIWIIVENGVTKNEIIMFDGGDALENHEISKHI